jgi:cold shock CspA family protein
MITQHNNIDFGLVKKYISDRGFGFVTRTFLSNEHSEVFFHIKGVRNSQPILAKNLDDDEYTQEIYFWYESEKSEKGDQVSKIIERSSIHLKNESPHLVKKVREIWLDINRSLPTWISDVTFDLLGQNGIEKFRRKREKLELERIEEDAFRISELEARCKAEEESHQKSLEKDIDKKQIQNHEFKQLVAEIKPYDFKESRQVSQYIIKNKLGKKYKHISGILKMEVEGSAWSFKGGFPPKIYSLLCSELGLKSQGTRARVVSFESFNDLNL